jgi:hypothetical protein
MAFCTYCGQQISDQAAACPKCGHPTSTLAARGRMEPLAIWALALGIAGLVACPFIPSIIAVILGSQAKTRLAMDDTLQGDQLAKTGVILGWIGIGLGILVIIGIIVLVASGIYLEQPFDGIETIGRIG